MVKIKRVTAILMSVVVLAAMVIVPANADLTYPFQDHWTLTTGPDGTATVAVELSHVNAGTEYESANDAQEFRYWFAELMPQMLIEQDGVEIVRADIPAPAAGAASTSLEVFMSSPGVYDAKVVTGNGLDDEMVVCGWWYDGNLYPSGWDTFEVVDYGGEAGGITLDEYYAMDCRFIVESEQTADSVKLTLSGIMGESGADLSALIEECLPIAELVLYDDDGTIISDYVHLFSGNKMTLDISGAAGCEIYVCNSTDGVCAIKYDAELGGYDTAYFVYGQVPDVAYIDFTDVSWESWYADSVYYAAEMGLVTGTGDGTTFSPNDNMSFAEAITLAARMHALYYGIEIDTTAAGGAWFQPYIDYAEENGIPCKYSDYNAKVTRADYLHIFYAALPEEEYTAENTVPDGSVPDVGMSHQYADEIYTFYRAGIINGTDDKGSFMPNDRIMRCEVAAILCRMMDPAFRMLPGEG